MRAFHLSVGALIAMGWAVNSAHAVVIPVTYQVNSWTIDGAPIAISTASVGVGNVQNVTAGRRPAQTFTTTNAFTLDKIWLKYTNSKPGSENYTMTLDLFEVADPNAATLPTGTSLFSSPQVHNLPADIQGGTEMFVAFDVENIALQANKSYAFIFNSITGTNANNFAYQLLGTPTSSYAGGSGYRQDSATQKLAFDFYFALQEFIATQPSVAMPEPATGVLLLAGTVLLANRRRMV